MTDISYKELKDKFLERDKNACDSLDIQYRYGDLRIEDRVAFTEGRLKDICQVVIHLLEKLENEYQTKTN